MPVDLEKKRTALFQGFQSYDSHMYGPPVEMPSYAIKAITEHFSQLMHLSMSAEKKKNDAHNLSVLESECRHEWDAIFFMFFRAALQSTSKRQHGIQLIAM